MSEFSYETIRQALANQPLFEAKTWQLSPSAWKITAEQFEQLKEIGTVCLEFHQALETLYLRSATGKNLLRNKSLLAPWVAEYLDRGKPASIVAYGRDPANRGVFPAVLRPDLLLTDEGFVMSELDSVPGGIGLTGFLNRLYSGGAPLSGSASTGIIGADDAMVRNFHAALASSRPEIRNPLIAIVVSDEAGTYRPEMEWLAHQLQLQGKRVFCLEPDEVFPLGTTLCFDVEGNPEKIDVIYRFFELFDLENIRTAKYMLEAWTAGEVAIVPPMRAFQEEKLSFALFHHHRLQDFWSENLGRVSLKLLRQLIPRTWVMDDVALPPGAVLEGPMVGGRALTDWRQLAGASQKERDLIMKISGFHETAWGARSVILGSDCSREEWQAGLEITMTDAPTHLHILQDYMKPRRVQHPIYSNEPGHAVLDSSGRLRLCPYYFVVDGEPRLSGALATFCPPDKKIIHGMQDAALLPTGI